MESTQHYRAQLEAAYELLEGDSTTLAKLEKIKTLVKGVSPALDAKLNAVFKAYHHLHASWEGDVVHLTSHGLPVATPADKKRKKTLLAFLASWKSLKSEVGRVGGYSLSAASVAKTGLFAKGPLGLITIAAVVIVGVGVLVRSATTTVIVENFDCPPLAVPTLPLDIPGLRLPSSIDPGIPVRITLPALSVEVRATSSQISATILGQTGTYSLPPRVTDITFDGESLLNTSTTLDLSGRSHSLVITCN